MTPLSTHLASLKSLTSEVLAYAKSQGATQAEVDLCLKAGFVVRSRLANIDTIEHHRDNSATVTFYLGKRKACVNTSEMQWEALQKLVDKASALAKYAQKDNCQGLADAKLMATSLPDLDLYHPWEITLQQAGKQAIACEKQALAVDKRLVNSEGVEICSHQSVTLYANSHGFIGETKSTCHSIFCALIARENDHMERDSHYTISRHVADLMDTTKLAKLAANKTLRRLGARKVKTGKVPVIFQAEVARSLLKLFANAISGLAIYKKTSFLRDCLGKQIFPTHISIYENPHQLRGLGSAAFDNEGVATYSKDFVTKGLLKQYALDSYSACKLGMTTTANAGGISNLFISHGPHDLPALLKKMDKGLLVTELMGQGVNLVTGDYSRGASGYWVENGSIQYPVSEVTIAGNLKDMYSSIVEVGCDVDPNSRIHSGSILLDTMTIGGR